MLYDQGEGRLQPSDDVRMAWRLNAEKRRWSRRIIMLCVAGAALGLFAANPILTATGLLVLPVLFHLLWKMGEPPVLLFAAVLQWLQVFVPVLNADAHGQSLGETAGLPELAAAAALGLAAIVALASGMRLGRGMAPVATQGQLKTWVADLSPARLLAAYFGTLAFSLFAIGGSEAVPGLGQGLIALGLFRWMVAFLLLWAAMNERRFRQGALLVVVIEVLLGFGSFFSSFKTILFLATIVVLGNEVKLGRLLRPGVVALLTACLLMITYWQAIKDDYRSFLNQGTQSQTVLVTPRERLGFIVEKSLSLTLSDLVAALQPSIDRIGYIQFFALSMQQVPNHIPYQQGRLWGRALTHVLTPRLFNPSKAAVHDSDLTNEFSGVRVAGADEGTSISLGYVVESYIDFGPVLMFLPVLLAGVLWGAAYRWLATRPGNRLLGLSAATVVILVGATLFESSSIKLLGGALTNVVVLSMLLMFGGKRLWKALCGNRR